MNRHIIPDQVLTRPEPLDEAVELARVPAEPYAFMRLLIGRAGGPPELSRPFHDARSCGIPGPPRTRSAMSDMMSASL